MSNMYGIRYRRCRVNVNDLIGKRYTYDSLNMLQIQNACWQFILNYVEISISFYICTYLDQRKIMVIVYIIIRDTANDIDDDTWIIWFYLWTLSSVDLWVRKISDRKCLHRGFVIFRPSLAWKYLQPLFVFYIMLTYSF